MHGHYELDGMRARIFGQWALRLLLLAGIIVGYGLVLRATFTSQYRGANDFFIPWRATQALIWEGRDPYGAEVTAEIQRTLFGRERAAGEHQFDFAYPLTLAPLLAPYTAVSYTWAQPLWQATVHILLLGGLLLWWRSLHPALPRPLGLVLLLLWALSVYPAARAFILGQVALLVFGAVALALWALLRGEEALAGVALAVATVKPQLSFLIVPSILALAWASGQRRVLWSFGLTFGLLLALAWLLMPDWISAFLSRLGDYQRYTNLGSASDSPAPLVLLRRLSGPLGPVVVGVGALLLSKVVELLWKQRQQPDWAYVGSVLLLVSGWIAPRTATTDQTLLLLPLLFWLRPHSRWVVGLVLGGLWLGLWLLFFGTLQGDQEQLILRLPLPLVVSLLWALDWRQSVAAPQAGQPLAHGGQG